LNLLAEKDAVENEEEEPIELVAEPISAKAKRKKAMKGAAN